MDDLPIAGVEAHMADGAVEEHQIARMQIALGPARVREGLLADRLVELQVVDTISTETVRQVLKKTR